jgi:hypothetical protein
MHLKSTFVKSDAFSMKTILIRNHTTENTLYDKNRKMVIVIFSYFLYNND